MSLCHPWMIFHEFDCFLVFHATSDKRVICHEPKCVVSTCLEHFLLSLFKVIYEVDQLALAEIALTMAASANVYEEEMEEEEEEVQMKNFFFVIFGHEQSLCLCMIN